MSSIYVDTSSLVKFYYPEPDSDEVESLLLKTERIYVSYLTIVEMASALSKKVRAKELKKQMETVLWNTFLDDLQAPKLELVVLNERHYLKAADFIREFGEKFNIKALDSLHLSIVHGLDNSAFLCSDDTLCRVASKIGIKLLRL